MKGSLRLKLLGKQCDAFIAIAGNRITASSGSLLDEYNIEKKKDILLVNVRLMKKQMQHDLIVYEPEKCIKCGLCVEISAEGGREIRSGI